MGLVQIKKLLESTQPLQQHHYTHSMLRHISVRFFAAKQKSNRLVFRSRIGTSKIGRNLTQGPPQDLNFFAHKAIRSSRQSAMWSRACETAYVDWIQGSASHRQTSGRLLELAESLDSTRTIPESLFVLENLLSAVGLFEAGNALALRGHDLILRDAEKSPSVESMIRAIQVSLVVGDLDLATNSIARLRSIIGRSFKRARYSASISDLENYVSLWQGDECSFPDFVPDKPTVEAQWRSYIRGRTVVVYGPGESSGLDQDIPNDDVVIRIAGPGSFNWTDHSDYASGRTDVVYLIPETLAVIGSSNQERTEIFAPYKFVGLKRSSADYIPNLRRVESGSRLFLTGHPNMVPLVCIDALRVPEVKVSVLGSNFFASSIAYRQDSLRSNPDKSSQTSAGSSGRQFDRTTLMASHNAIQNRAVVKNLVTAGHITGDKEFLEAVNLSNLDYVRRLDEIYGQERV